MNAWLHFGGAALGTPQGPFLTVNVDVIEAPLSHHKRGLSYTATGYGNLYLKRSTRTAVIVKSRSYNPNGGWATHDDYSGQWGFFPARQAVNQEGHWWEAMARRGAVQS
jgi:hypothetical protein